jgi:hypothetical protein
MFNREDLQGVDVSQHYLRFYRGLYFITYPQFAFRVPDSEETIRISRAPKRDEDNGLHFWLAAEHLDDWSTRTSFYLPYLQNAAFEQISEDRFNELVAAQCSELLCQPQLPLKNSGKFVGAMLMYSMKTDFIVDLFAEYDDEFIHFYWETAA